MRIRSLAGALALAATAAVVPLTSAQAAPTIRFSKIYFDSPGSDTGSNTSLNAEWVRVRNYGTHARTITGWRIHDNTGYTYKFPTFTLKAGATVTLHTGQGTRTATNHYWGRSWYVWNNTGDRATLVNSAGTVVDRCAYSGAGDYVAC